MSVFLKKGQEIDLHFNSPFLSGVGFNSHYLLINGYKYFQEKIAKDLSAIASGDWSGGRHELQRGKAIVPHFLVSRYLTGDALKDALVESELDVELPVFAGGTGKKPDAIYTIRNVELRYSDFGYGYIVIKGGLSLKRDLSGEELRNAGEYVASEITRISGLIRSTCFLIMNAVPEPIRARYVLAGTSNKYGKRVGEDTSDRIGRLANQPRIFTLRCKDDREFAEKKAMSRELLISQSPDYTPDSALKDGLVVHVGSGSSVLIYNAEKVSDEDGLVLLNTHQVMNYFYHIIEDYTSDLFFHNNRLNLMPSMQGTDLIEDEMRLILEYKAQITFFMAVYNDYDNHLDPQGLQIWRDIEARWEARDRFAALKDQLGVSQSIYEWLNNDLSNMRGKSITTFVLIFTVLSMLSVVVDTVDFTQGGELQLPSMFRLAVLAIMVCLIIVFAKVFSGRQTARMKVFSKAARRSG